MKATPDSPPIDRLTGETLNGSDGMEMSDIAFYLGMTTAQVKTIHDRALKKLRGSKKARQLLEELSEGKELSHIDSQEGE